MDRRQIIYELEAVERTLRDIKAEMSSISKRMHQCLTVKKSLDAALEALGGRELEPVISGHAKLRYIERVLGLNVEAMDEYILPAKLWDATKGVGPRSIDVHDDEGYSHTVRMKDNVVTTVVVKK